MADDWFLPSYWRNDNYQSIIALLMHLECLFSAQSVIEAVEIAGFRFFFLESENDKGG